MLGTYFLYSSILFFSTFFVYIYEKEKNSILSFCFIFVAFLIVFIPSAIRYNIGIDYSTYVEIFNLIEIGEVSHVEIGYEYLNRLIIFLGFEPEVLVVVVSFLTCFFIFKGYPKEGAWVINFLFVSTIYLYTFSNFRTGIVLAVMFYATMKYLDKKNLFHFISCLLISFLFHKAAILLALIPVFYSSLLARIVWYRLILIIVSFFLIFLFFLRHQFITIIVDSSLIDYFGYSNYLNSELFFKKTELSSGLGVIARSAPVVLFIYMAYSSGLIQSNRKVAFGVSLSFFYILLIILTTAVSIFSRLETVFYIVYMVTGYLSYVYFSKFKKIIFTLFVVFIWSILFFKNIYESQSSYCNGLRISPYVSIFNKHDDNSLGVPRVICEYW